MQTGTRGGRKKISEAKHSAILGAARRIFLAQGFTSAGMAEIARMADVSTATLYKHFNSKETLFIAVVTQTAQDAGDYSGLLDQDETARGILDKVCRTYLNVQFDRETNALMRIVIAEVPNAPQLAREMYEVLGNRRNESLRELLEGMIARGLLRPHDAAFGARLGSGLIKEFFVWPALFDADYKLPLDTDEKIRRCIDAYLALYGPEK
ncbi:transcriptional regulator, TetR family [Parvibaculum lavamentivorans DS-1]|uniref:Transcriptional regulator, TetR family n=1 Tax=Parvibaculum lavamentivorans (strain DS-1 / DSM 13023 / NCIMB 13966) TaxID=402881 RepID=A7HVH3_PARL1|nr:TetR/AcrR family transcriptional regulator [Parvibaculum lavamentivorans]ABS63906.1 transcriptional regulator, TetR family [Parvibaculum lavamentivorans DS-1]